MNMQDGDDAFRARQQDAKAEINALDADRISDEPKRHAFFDEVYQRAEDDPALVPWADLQAKDKLAHWLANNPGEGRNAIDVGCGLGDNAEAISQAGFSTIGFDFSADAIGWAKRRFPDSSVDYQVQDLTNLPNEWLGHFDLVHECYTLQSLPPETLSVTLKSVASLVCTGGLLLVYARVRKAGEKVEGPPWPLEANAYDGFSKFGFDLVSREAFEIVRPDKTIPHIWDVWRKV